MELPRGGSQVYHIADAAALAGARMLARGAGDGDRAGFGDQLEAGLLSAGMRIARSNSGCALAGPAANAWPQAFPPA